MFCLSFPVPLQTCISRFYFLFYLLVNLHGDRGNKGAGGAKGSVNGGGVYNVGGNFSSCYLFVCLFVLRSSQCLPVLYYAFPTKQVTDR